MRRHRVLRGRPVALALLPLAALTATTALILAPASSAQTEAQSAQIRSSKAAVRIGNRIVLRGQFADAPNARVQIQRRPTGKKRWVNAARTKAGPAGAYRVRLRPRGTARWRARVAPTELASSDSAADGAPGALATNAARVKVRSRTRARISRRHISIGGKTRVRGRVRPGGRRKVTVRGGGRSVSARTRPNGKFSVRWPAGSNTGRYKLRVRAGANRRAIASSSKAGKLTVYRPAHASYYGPGFYGGRTACGQTLTTSTQGVAHKTLPCGTKLRLRYGGRTVTARVIDRGPYAAGRELDLTYATKRRLGFGSTGTVLMAK